MKKILFLAMMCLASTFLHSRIFEVCLYGEKQFTTIQCAINKATVGDTILVHPGVYRENLRINFIDKNSPIPFTLQSLYAVNNDQKYIQNTVISGMPDRSAISIVGYYSGFSDFRTVTNVVINGFTIMNNKDGIAFYSRLSGGGINIYATNAVIKNNIIRNCIAGY